MDFSSSARELEIEETEYLSLLKLFETHALRDLDELRAAMQGPDLTAAHSAAHSIKGASGSLNLLEIHDAASLICAWANDGIAEPIGPKVTYIQEQLDALSQALCENAGGD